MKMKAVGNQFSLKTVTISLLVFFSVVSRLIAEAWKWEMQALVRLLSFRDSLNSLGINTLVIDTSPGIQYSSLNAIVAADIALVVTTLEGSDFEGTKVMLRDLYGSFEKKTAVIVNKVPFDLLQSERLEKVQNDLNPLGLVFNEVISCSCDIPLSENPCFFACRNGHHEFSRTLEKIVLRIATVKRDDLSVNRNMSFLTVSQ